MGVPQILVYTLEPQPCLHAVPARESSTPSCPGVEVCRAGGKVQERFCPHPDTPKSLRDGHLSVNCIASNMIWGLDCSLHYVHANQHNNQMAQLITNEISVGCQQGATGKDLVTGLFKTGPSHELEQSWNRAWKLVRKQAVCLLQATKALCTSVFHLALIHN